MYFEIDTLKGYLGGKSGSGTYQKIINIIPPHKTLAIPFLGHCGITRNIKRCDLTLINDFNMTVIDAWGNYLLKHCNLDLWRIHNLDYYDFLVMTVQNTFDRPDTVIYCDPPYLWNTRKSKHRYEHELTNDDHIKLLELLKTFEHAKILISTYDNDIYAKHLKGWNKISFTNRTRGGTAIETVYFNYDKPDRLHDYSYIGDNYREREQYQIKKKNLIDKFERMSPLEKNFFADVLKNEFSTLF